MASYKFGSCCPCSPPCCGGCALGSCCAFGSVASFTGFARVYPRTVATSGLPFLFLETQVGTLGTPADPYPLPAAEDVVISSITCLINSLIFCFKDPSDLIISFVLFILKLILDFFYQFIWQQ